MRNRRLGHAAIGLGVPFLACLALVPFRDSMANTNVALVLVLIIVAVAALGSRATGVLAALSAAAWFDFFLRGRRHHHPDAMIEQVSNQLVRVLGVTSCRFDHGTGLAHPRLEADGRVLWGDQVWDVDGIGLPVQKETEIRAMCAGRFMGRFLVTAAPDTRPSQGRRTLAASLANLAGVALGADLAGRREQAGKDEIPAPGPV